MIAIFLMPIYIAFNVLIVSKTLKWTYTWTDFFKKPVVKWIYILIYAVLSSTLVFAFWMKPSIFRTICYFQGNLWLGMMLYILMAIGIISLVHLITWIFQREKSTLWFQNQKHRFWVGLITMIAILGTCTSGIVHTYHLKQRDYDVTIKKNCGTNQDLTVALVADWHLGSTIGVYHMKKMVEYINAMNADVVVVAGDMFDNNYDLIDYPDEITKILSTIQSKYGVYACWGNHDVEEKILAGFTFGKKDGKKHNEEMYRFFEKANITLLEDESVLIDNSFYIVGRLDEEKPGNITNDRKTPNELLEQLDKTKPIIVVDHEPRELQEVADAGADMDLCGHTHDGQTFPGNLTIHLFWENACGYLKKGNMHNIVTSGVGVWGPVFRVGTDCEVVQIHVNFES